MAATVHDIVLWALLIVFGLMVLLIVCLIVTASSRNIWPQMPDQNRLSKQTAGPGGWSLAGRLLDLVGVIELDD